SKKPPPVQEDAVHRREEMSHRLHHVAAQQTTHGVRKQPLPVREAAQRAGSRPGAQRVPSQDLVPEQESQGQKGRRQQEPAGRPAKRAGALQPLHD
ncbi:hypothetical protein AVEN_201600-1, partial [Araneus ventricosus]